MGGAPEASHTDTARSHLRNALQGLSLIQEEAGGRLPLNDVVNRIRLALVILDRVQAEARLHPFSFAQHVAEVV